MDRHSALNARLRRLTIHSSRTRIVVSSLRVGLIPVLVRKTTIQAFHFMKTALLVIDVQRSLLIASLDRSKPLR